MTFEQAFADFIVAFDRNLALQARCAAGESVDLAECVYVRHMLSVASEALVEVAKRQPPPVKH